MRFAEKWGDSVDDAVELALQDLKLTRDRVVITVLEEPSRGFFGIGSRLAKVRVEEKQPEKPAKPEAPAHIEKKIEKAEEPEAPKAEDQNTSASEVQLAAELEADTENTEITESTDKPEIKKGARRDRKRNSRKSQKRELPVIDYEFNYEESGLLSEKPENLKEDNENPAKAFLDDMFREMGLDVTVKVFSGDDCVYAEVEGADCGTVIGKRGQTLDAVQYLTSLVVNKGKNGYIRTIIDAEGYRRKRELTLEKLAIRLADKAARSGRSVRLEPMNPYERKVIHSVLQKHPVVSTRSEGEEPYRRVIIEPHK